MLWLRPLLLAKACASAQKHGIRLGSKMHENIFIELTTCYSKYSLTSAPLRIVKCSFFRTFSFEVETSGCLEWKSASGIIQDA